MLAYQVSGQAAAVHHASQEESSEKGQVCPWSHAYSGEDGQTSRPLIYRVDGALFQHVLQQTAVLLMCSSCTVSSAVGEVPHPTLGGPLKVTW